MIIGVIFSLIMPGQDMDLFSEWYWEYTWRWLERETPLQRSNGNWRWEKALDAETLEV
jgi:hypothetical protein